MKIIAKHPDYYDYYSHVFGIDPLIRYERNSEFTDPPEKVFAYSGKFNLKIARFFICGTVYDILFDAASEKLLYGNQLAQLSEEQMKITMYPKVKPGYLDAVRHPKVAEVNLWGDYKDKKWYVLTEPMNIDEFKTVFEPYFTNGTSNRYKDQNLILNCPVVVTLNDRCFKNPILANWGFGNIIPADVLFTKISNWFLERTNKDIPNNQTDMEKLTSHGFDRKTSFRH